MSRDGKRLTWIGPLLVFIAAALVTRLIKGGDDGSGISGLLFNVLLVSAMLAVLWGFFVAGKNRQARRRR